MAIFTVTNLFDSGAGSLRNAILQANTASTTDIIDFDTSLGGTISLTSGEFRITDNLTINGLGADLLSVDAGDNPFRVFNVNDADENSFLEVAIKGLTITGGNADDGGGILNSENLTLANSTVSGNTANSDGGGIYSFGNSAVLTLTDSVISGNSARSGYGGGINNHSGSLTVTNSTISDNSADFYDGGGISNDDGNVTVTNSTIADNSASFVGGGIRSDGGSLAVTDSTISGNTSLSVGGGISNSRGDLTVSNSNISGNTAGNYGGGISTFYGQATVTNSMISGNTARYGGGINDDFGALTVTGSTISGNTADNGGAISNDAGYLIVTDSILSSNVANGDGGAIFNPFSNVPVTITNSTISGNIANNGGGISNQGDLTVINSTISGNTANGDGGGIQNSFGILTVNNSTISGNTANDDGGGIFNYIIEDSVVEYDNKLTVTNSTISGNTADEGGGIFVNLYSYDFSASTTVTSSIIAANTNNEDIASDGRFRDARFTTGGNNLIGNGDGAEGFTNGVNSDLVGTTGNPIDPLLGELQDNGGPTLTQVLLPGSPAINAGSNPLNLEFDQRGPGFDRVVGAQTDIGAYEVPEPDSTLGVLGVAVLGVVLFRKHQRLRKTKA